MRARKVFKRYRPGSRPGIGQHYYKSYSSLKMTKREKRRTEDQILKEFGETDNPYEAGFLTKEGKMVNFSGKNIGGDSGTRVRDHRDIIAKLPAKMDYNEKGEEFESASMPLIRFMQESGWVRMSKIKGRSGEEDSLSVDYVQKPTKKQQKALSKMAKDSEVYVDQTPKTGDPPQSFEFHGKIKPSAYQFLTEEEKVKRALKR